jgi:hypothetical protein
LTLLKNFLSFILLLVKQHLVHHDEELESIADEAVDGLVPVVLTISIEGREHYRQDGGCVVTDQAHDISKDDDYENDKEAKVYLLIVKVVQTSLSHLEVWTAHTLGELVEERDHHLLELCRLYHIQNFLQFTQKHHLLRTVNLGPVPGIVKRE